MSATLATLSAEIMTAYAASGLAEPAIYRTTPTAVSISCSVLLDRDVQPIGFESQVVSRQVTITALTAEVGEPRRGAQFAIGAETFVVDSIEALDAGRVVCRVVAGGAR